MNHHAVGTAARRPFTRASALIGLAAAALGLAIVVFRFFDLDALESVLAFAVRGVRASTGYALLLGGLAFLGLHRGMEQPLVRTLSLAALLGVAGAGIAGLATARWTSGELEAVPVAFALTLIGVTASWAALAPRRGGAISLVAAAALAIALLILLGHAYSARPFYELGGDQPARAGSALGCALLALALLLARPSFPLSRILAADSMGADHLRSTLPVLLALPVAVSLVTLAGLRAGLYGENVAFALFTILAIAGLGLLGAASARRIDLLARDRAALEGLFQRTFDNASVGVARLDAQGRWQHANTRLCEIVGWPREELIGRHADAITHPDDLAAERALLEALARGELDSQHTEKRTLTKQGHPVWVDAFVSAERDPDGQVTGYVAIVQDIGARKRAERAKDEFFALISHELRSPLHVLGGWLSVLRRETDPKVRERALAVAERSAALLGRLIGDLLDASRIASGKLEIEREVFDLQEIVQAVVASFEPLARSRGVELRLSLPDATPFVAGDAARIEQVARNLLDNATKFTPAGGRVEVTLERSGAEAMLTVSDTGQGIAPELLPRIFERLTQGEGGPRGAQRGLGLGLSIVRHLVERHGGRIDAYSDGVGRGTRFVIRLPEAPMPRRLAPLALAEETDALDGVSVLLVKPDRAAAEVLALALEAADAGVVWARSVDEALTCARDGRPHAVIADLDLGIQDWASWLTDLRAAAGRRLAALAVSSDDHAAARRQARAAGFDAFLGRPVEPRRLVAVLHALLQAPRRRVLVVDDDQDAADSLAILLARRGYEVERAYAIGPALEVAERFRPSAVLTDLQLGNEDGAQLARALRAGALRSARIVAVSGRELGELGSDARLFYGAVRKPIDLDGLLAVLRGTA